jgi:hypothetical protein
MCNGENNRGDRAASYIGKLLGFNERVNPEKFVLADLFSNVYATFHFAPIRTQPGPAAHHAARAHDLENL